MYINGLFNDKAINGILYDPNGNIIYKGDFINDKPKEGKNLKIYEHNGEIKYEGDFLDGDYTYGTLYGYGKYFKKRRKLYEGQFKKEKYHGIGKLYKDIKIIISEFIYIMMDILIMGLLMEKEPYFIKMDKNFMRGFLWIIK